MEEGDKKDTLFIIPDTNFFIHKKFFTSIDWNAFSISQKFELIVLQTVLSELGKKKYENKRARRVIQQFNQMEKNKADAKKFRVCVLIQSPQWSELQTLFSKEMKFLDPHINDDQIFAEILTLKQKFPNCNIVFLTEDYLARKKAQSLGITVEDCSDNPLFKMESKKESKNKSNLQKAPNLEAFFDKEKKELILTTKIPHDLHLAPILPKDIEDYNERATSYNTDLIKQKGCQKIDIWILNSGNAPATDIDVFITCTVEKEIKFILESDYEKLDPIKPPVPQMSVPNAFSFFTASTLKSFIPDILSSTIATATMEKENFSSMHRIENERNHTWEMRYKIPKLKHGMIRRLQNPPYILIPESTKSNKIKLRFLFTLDQDDRQSDQKLIIIIKKDPPKNVVNSSPN